MKNRMKKQNKKSDLGSLVIIFVIIIALSTLAILFGQNGMVFYHESGHQQIYSTYRIDSRIDLNLFDTSYTIPESPCIERDCIVLQRWNDIIGYHMAGFLFNMWLMLIVCLFAAFAFKMVENGKHNR